MKSYMNIGDYTIDTSAFELSENGVTIFDNNGNPIIHYKNHEFIGDFLQAPRQIKVVFDTHEDGDCVEYGKENLWGAFEWDIDVATDEEIKDLLGVR